MTCGRWIVVRTLLRVFGPVCCAIMRLYILDVEGVAKLRTLQKRIGAPVSESIRRAVAEYLKKDR